MKSSCPNCTNKDRQCNSQLLPQRRKCRQVQKYHCWLCICSSLVYKIIYVFFQHEYADVVLTGHPKLAGEVTSCFHGCCASTYWTCDGLPAYPGSLVLGQLSCVPVIQNLVKNCKIAFSFSNEIQAALNKEIGKSVYSRHRMQYQQEQSFLAVWTSTHREDATGSKLGEHGALLFYSLYRLYSKMWSEMWGL